MYFSSMTFLWVFLPITLILYFIAQRFGKNFAGNIVLLLASLIFYAWGEPVYILLLLVSVAMNYIFGILLGREREHGRKLILALGVLLNIGLLGFFKYFNFFAIYLNRILGGDYIPMSRFALPLGISFYTFQAMSYVIDVYRKEVKAQKNFFYLLLYISLFPQLVAGPIVKYKDIETQILERTNTAEKRAYGVKRFIYGLGKKVLLSNVFGKYVDMVLGFEAAQLSTGLIWLVMIMYTFQIYYDFSGYSDMAIGLGRMFGFHFLENFNYPFMSKSITEFWRRWHISLGSWFREYVYIPLGGNRVSLPKQVRNIAVVWLLTGFWHGANWNYVLWGVYFGVFLVIEKFFLAKYLKRLPKAVSHIYTLLIVWVSFVFFGLEDLSRAGEFVRSMFVPGAAGFVDTQALYLLRNYAVILVILAFGATDLPKRAADRLLAGTAKNAAAEIKMSVSRSRLIFATITRAAYLVLVFVIAMAYVVDATYNPFLYFRF